MTANVNQVLRPRGPQIERLAGNRAKVVDAMCMVGVRVRVQHRIQTIDPRGEKL